MNLYECWREYSGFGLTAIVSAESEQDAQSFLDWKLNADTTGIIINKIGVADSNDRRVWCEESL